jgi:glyoxylase-like metal-dependent hydrolase (beta-lactamase superfamily II)
MRITKLETNPKIYTSNTYLIRGDYNTLQDVNTLVDAGGDEQIIARINEVYTGAGKRAVEHVILTHCHFDHYSTLKYLKSEFNVKVYAFNCERFTDFRLKDDDIVKAGDSQFHVIHTPGHSNDSVCLYNYEQRILFSGDTPLDLKSHDSTYSREYILALERITKLKIDIIYPGHGNPITENIKEMLDRSLKIVKSQMILDF